MRDRTRAEPRRLLILGGTAEAAALARAVSERFGGRLKMTTALAGRTEQPGPLPGDLRIGGFGGVVGLAAYLTEARVDLLIDATHPFAESIARHARVASAQVGVPRLVLERPPWRRDPLDRWIEVGDVSGVAAAVARVGRRCFLTIGVSGLGAFEPLRHVHFLVRLIDPPKQPLPLASYEVVLGRGPFTLAAERDLLRRHEIDVLAVKASGGAATEAKLIAAREAALPVVMLSRPKPEPGPRASTVEAALAWLEERLSRTALPLPEAARR
ncbi:MAG TPA: cobalt-precorrin-6A reductase [Stellaceae bacterium]|jgi:precorrin-6A/cobalt-precorrin-6A reductase|nr:cobalt-precorrin-6A reductase [Stellaceae bacterium]